MRGGLEGRRTWRVRIGIERYWIWERENVRREGIERKVRRVRERGDS